MASSLVEVTTRSGQIYFYEEDEKTGKKRRVPAPSVSSSSSSSRSRSKKSPSRPRTESKMEKKKTDSKRSAKKREEEEEEEATPKESKQESRDIDLETWRLFLMQHCEFIRAISQLTKLGNSKTIERQCEVLLNEWTNVEGAEDYRGLVERMRQLKLNVKFALKVEDTNPCYVALFDHMLGELDDVDELLKSPGYLDKRHVSEHMRIYAIQDAEAQEFVACDVPTLVTKPSKLLTKVIKENKALAKQLKAFAASATKSRSSYLEYAKLRSKHVTGSLDFVKTILPELDMPEDIRDLVRRLVVHEVNESNWAASVVQRNMKL